MKHDGVHAGAILVALFLFALASVLTWFNRTTIGSQPWLLGGVGVCIAFALALSIPSDARRAASFIASYVPMLRGGSPPANPPDGGTS